MKNALLLGLSCLAINSVQLIKADTMHDLASLVLMRGALGAGFKADQLNRHSELGRQADFFKALAGVAALTSLTLHNQEGMDGWIDRMTKIGMLTGVHFLVNNDFVDDGLREVPVVARLLTDAKDCDGYERFGIGRLCRCVAS